MINMDTYGRDAKQKAEYFYHRFTPFGVLLAKEISNMIVDEVLSSAPTQPSEAYLEDWNDDYNQLHIEETIQAREYWQQVKKEIELL